MQLQLSDGQMDRDALQKKVKPDTLLVEMKK